MNIKFIRKIVLAWRSSSYWNDAFHSYVVGDYSKSIAFLSKYEKIRLFRSREKLLEGLIYCQLNQLVRARKSLEWAFNHLGQDKRQNLDEDKYLANYIIRTLDKISDPSKIDDNSLENKLQDYNFNALNVRKSFTENFPLK